MFARVIVCVALASIAVAQGISFASIGDWGCAPIGGWHAQDEITVANQFMKSAAAIDAKFILNPGDNFYYCGVHAKDQSMWDSTFENVFSAQSTMVPWFNALGNHDYGYTDSVDAQLNYTSPNGNRWKFPGRYYYQRIQITETEFVSLVVLDTSPCQSPYRSSNPSGWDPCGSVIPGCPGCTFHENVVAQSCQQQLAWVEQIVKNIPANDWKIALFHSPVMDIDVEDLITPLQKAGFHLYVNGHVHLLAHYQIDNGGTYITSGAGCMVRIEEQEQGKDKDARAFGATSCTTYSKTHSCQIVWQQKIAGYTTHTFSADYTSLTTYFYDYQGNQLHSVTTPKSGSPQPGPGPNPNPNPNPPSPPSPPGPGGKCCYYDDEYCQKGETCCSEKGYSYGEYECTVKNGPGWKHYCRWTGSTCIVD